MKKRNVYSLLTAIFTLLLLALYFIACQEEEKFIPLKIFSLEPTEALIGDTIIIRGEGFSPELLTNGIFFQGAERIVPFKMDRSQLFVAVPEGALPGPVTVNILNEETSDSPPLDIIIPVVSNITPEQAWVGDTVMIYGENFRPRAIENKVRFQPAPSGVTAYVISGSSTELKVIVPVTQSTSTVQVMGFDGPEFTTNTPVITSINPVKGVIGDTVTIAGRGLPVNGTASLGSKATSIVITRSTAREVKVLVPADAVDGSFRLRYSTGMEVNVTSAQVFEVNPDISTIAPFSGEAGVPVTITGTGFSKVASENSVSFNGSAATITEASSTQLVAIVPDVFTTGPVSVTVNGRTVEGPVFTLSPPGTPIIYNISPASGPAGSNVVINGKNFDPSAGSNTVKFSGNVTATVLTASGEQLTVRVPAGAQTGQLSVTKDGKTGLSPVFTVTAEATPFIASITPNPATRGGTLTINGGNFSANKNDIVVNTPQGDQLTVMTAAENVITVTVPAEFPAGQKDIRVNQSGRTSNSVPVFIAGQPVITSLSIDNGYPGTTVTITGNDFSDRESDHTVRFGNVTATIVDPGDLVLNVITVFVPDVPAGVHDLTVTLGNTSNAIPFEVKDKPVAVKNVYLAARITGTDGQKWKILKSTFEPPSLTVTYEGAGADINALAADFTHNKIYMYVSTAPPVLARSNLDNTGYQELYTEDEMAGLYDFTLDIPRGRIYWSSSLEAKVMSGNMDGSGTPEVLYTYDNGNIGFVVYGISYHQPDDMLYLIEYNMDSGLPSVSKIKADGTGAVISLFTDEDGLTDPRDVRIDSQHGKLFIVDAGTVILSGNADGSGTLSSFTTFQPGYQLVGMALDIQDQYVYWAETDGAGTTDVYRKRYDSELIPGTTPASNVQKIYTIDGVTVSRDSPTGLVIEESSGNGANQRMRFSSMSVKTRSWKKK